ncbi:unnamed protein product, partial [Amoebophrya sp. A25]
SGASSIYEALSILQLSFVNNACARKPLYRGILLSRFPNLKVLDGLQLLDEEQRPLSEKPLVTTFATTGQTVAQLAGSDFYATRGNPNPGHPNPGQIPAQLGSTGTTGQQQPAVGRGSNVVNPAGRTHQEHDDSKLGRTNRGDHAGKLQNLT